MFSYYSKGYGSSYYVNEGEIITFDKKLVNIGANFDGSTFTCQKPGIYEFNFAGTSSASELNKIQVLKNNLEVLEFFDDTAQKGDFINDESLMTFSFILKLNMNEKIKLKVTQRTILSMSDQYRVFTGKFIRPLV